MDYSNENTANNWQLGVSNLTQETPLAIEEHDQQSGKLEQVVLPCWSFKTVELVDSVILRSNIIVFPYTSGLNASSPWLLISTVIAA